VTNATRQDADEFLHLAEEYQLRTTIKEYKINEINQALMDMKSSSFDGEAVVTFGS
jgi:D-arabinose 1-dehydrogenase-like Zn-dependent alcohol dehydrogenase